MQTIKQKDSWICGVCAYLGNNTIIPTWLWRVGFVLTPGSGLWYLGIWFIASYQIKD